ncbi:hypothetical protein D0817_05200 [Flavobacterium cupreum]|uniref:Uncharacterized protein n=1 Tax=Flavobacterium cupreum TaxID=2133766 RepID=A0A434AA10_9FLAO|nr:hypothetical protein [Flavobacterium cupreum]RUT71279.1 hypothetical protein D0817_05200 [Flavobacterium cupreum]
MIKRKAITLGILMVCISIFEKCSFYDSNISSTILNHQIIYDSINYKVKNFNVNLYITLEFKNKNIERNQYNDFLLIIEKDTFPLIPQVNYLKKENHGQIQIRYLSKINFQSNRYDNDSILNIIKKYSKVINSKGKEINKNKGFIIEPLILLHMPKNNGIKI